MFGSRGSRLGMSIALLVVIGASGAAVFLGHLGSSGERPGSWSAAANLTLGREEHTATLLRDGRVLVAGGTDGKGHPLASAVIYDPHHNAWLPAGQMSTERVDHTATLLDNGEVLMVGGSSTSDPPSALASAELYDPASNSWQPVAPMHSRRTRHSAVLLRDGRVLVAGGASYLVEGGGLLMSPPTDAEIFDTRTGQWSITAPMIESDFFPSVALLRDGRVLLAGGHTSSAEIYDPQRNSWSRAAIMPRPCDAATTTVLANGKVLLIGGEGELPNVPYPYDSTPVSCALSYDPAHNTWSTLEPMAAPRIAHTATLLANGRLLVVGNGLPGKSTAEVYDPSSNRWSIVSPLTRRYDHSATRLRNGSVLIVGGYPFDSGESAVLYDPAGGSVPLNPLAVSLWSLATAIVLLVLTRPWWRPPLSAWYSRQRSEDWVS